MESQNQHRLAIVEIAGRDSVAAAVAAIDRHGFETILPTIGYTGTETGDVSAPRRAIASLTQLTAGDVEVLEPVQLVNKPLWSALNARFAAELGRRFGAYSPCLACHLYFHLLRIPIAWEHDNAPIIAGERDTHDGRIKLSQTSASIDASVRIVAHAGIELLQPVRHADGAEIERIVGTNWNDDVGQLGCLLSGNYRDADGSVRYDETGYLRYIDEFFVPVGMAIVDAWGVTSPARQPTDSDNLDYTALVARVLSG